jgi:hypothetical protein
VIRALLVAIAAGVAIGVGVYHAGVTHGLEQGASGGRVVRVIGPGDEPGFFPFSFLLFPLFVIGTIVLARALFWRRPGHGWDHHGSGPGWRGRGAMLEDWHRSQHERDSGNRPAQGGGTAEPASV